MGGIEACANLELIRMPREILPRPDMCPHDRMFKVLLAGSCSAGKTSLVSGFVQGCGWGFNATPDPTNSLSFKNKNFMIDDSEVVRLRFWDLPSNYDSLTWPV